MRNEKGRKYELMKNIFFASSQWINENRFFASYFYEDHYKVSTKTES